MANLKQVGAQASDTLPSSPLAASPTGEGAVRPPTVKLGALVTPPNGEALADRVAPAIKLSDKPGDAIVVVKAATNSAASTLQGRDIDLLAGAGARIGVALTETTTSTGRRAIVLEGNNPEVMAVTRMAKAIKEDRAARPFLVGFGKIGPVYQIGPHFVAAPGGLVAVRREGAEFVPMGVIAPAGSVEAISEFVTSTVSATERLING